MYPAPRRSKGNKRVDNVTLAHKKNYIGTLSLQAELNRLDRERIIDMRMFDNDHRRFRNRQPRPGIYGKAKTVDKDDDDFRAKNSDSYSPTEECQQKPSYIKSTSVNMQDLHVLLFTDGEVDIDKVLCLYLLTAHKTETLSLPPKLKRASYRIRQLSPLERLIARAEKISKRPKIFRSLPLFLIDVPVKSPKKEPRRDPRLEDKVIVNTKIIQIIHSVIMALEATRSDLLKRFMYLIHDRSRIENIMTQPKMEAFYKSLYGQNILSCCESFELERHPENGAISFRIDVEPFEELIRLLRRNVLQISKKRTWTIQQHPTISTSSNEREPEKNLATEANAALDTCFSQASTSTSIQKFQGSKKLPLPKNVSSTICTLSKSAQEFFLNIEQYTDEEIDKRETMLKRQPKILKNTQLGFSNPPDYEDEEHKFTFDQNLSLGELAILLVQKVNEEATVDYQNMVENLLPDPNDSADGAAETPHEEDGEKKEKVTTKPPPTVVPTEEVPAAPLRASYSVKQTKCVACLKRITEPLPAPKSSNIRKFPMPKIGEASYFSSKSAQRISELIDEHAQRIQDESKNLKKRGRDGIISHRELERLAKDGPTEQTIEIIDLDEMDLARLRQEIRMAETAKKIKKFFESH